MFDGIKAGNVSIVMEQCYSGGFIDDFTRDNFTIATACSGDEVSYSRLDGSYDEFVYHWISAVALQDIITGDDVNANVDNDYVVSMHEAFEYAKQNDSQNETPQYQSMPNDWGSKTTINPLMILTLDGNDKMCDVETYQIQGLNPLASIYWSFGESGVAYVFPPLEIIDGQGTAQATFKRKGEYQLYIDENGVSHPVLIPYVGTQTIKATVTLNGNSCVLEKEVTMPDPEDELDMRIRDVNQTGLLPLMYFGGATIELALRTPVDEETARNIEWECVLEPDPNSTPASLGMTMTFTGNSVEIPTPLAFTGTVRVTATNTAACNNTGTFTMEVIASVMYIDFTNPASGSVDISVKETAAGTQEGVAAMSADAEVYAEPYMGEYRLELWHEVYGMVRAMDVEAGNPTVTVDLGGLTPGWYYVRLIADGEMKAVGKLMVR
ncbi:MAG: hypothetical protein IAC51_00640 [bacterium]|uniref:Uncharacterized protein n=1 Tax=Candidatus Aphodosoma intestinipullorum TaxID=2840674 RepID=A0A940IDW2_9BACT|nr:hypothetical protein [Candidatus Aphodosoma intestinipullorum]